MKLQTLQILQFCYRVQEHGRWCVGAYIQAFMCKCVCVCVCVVSCVVRELKWLCVCVESVCGMCVLCFGVVVSCFVFFVCFVCGVCCVLCVVWWCGGVVAWHAGKNPCVGSKRLRVSVQNASDTRRRFEPTHGEEGGEGESLISLVPSLFLSSPSPFSLPSFSSFVLFLFLFFFSSPLLSQ